MVNVQSRLDVVVKARADGLSAFDNLNQKVSKFSSQLRGVNFVLRLFGLSLTTILGGALVRGLIRQQEELARSLGRTRFFLSGFVDGTERGLIFANRFAEATQKAGIATSNLAREIGARALVALKDNEKATRFATAALVGHKLQLFDAAAAINAMADSQDGNTESFRTFLTALGIAAPEFASLETLIENFIRRNQDATQELTQFSREWTRLVGTVKQGASDFGGLLGDLFVPVLQLLRRFAEIPTAFINFLLNPSRETFFEFINIAGEFASRINRILLDAFLTTFEAIAGLFQGAVADFNKIWAFFATTIAGITVRLFVFLAELIFAGLTKMGNFIVAGLRNIAGVFVRGYNFIVNITKQFSNFLLEIWSSISSGIEDSVNNIITLISRIVSPIRNAISVISELISKIKEFVQEKAGAIFSGLGNIVGNLFADGGIVTRPTVGIVGEAGPEAIIPLDRLGSIGGGGSTINLTITGNTFMSDEDVAVKIGDMIVKRLQLVHRFGLTT